MIGQLLDGRYQVIQILGAGGFGQTYIAKDMRRPGNPTCVVKHLKPASTDPNFLQTARRLFTSEAETLEQLGYHDQIPRLLAYFEQNQEFYLVQEFVEGHILSMELQPGQRWEEGKAIQMLQEVLSILEFVHGQGVIHRDIKPDNIIRRQRDNKLVLVDFGAVKQVRTQMAAPLQVSATVAIGTPGYMPSEQGRGQPRPSSDIYSLGIIAIQALTGMMPTQIPEDNQTGEILWQQFATVSPGLAVVLNKMVRYHFMYRYQTATEALQALRQLTNPGYIVQSPTPAPYPQGYPPPPAYTPSPQAYPASEQHTIPVVPANPPVKQPINPESSSVPVSRRQSNVLPIVVGVGFAGIFGVLGSFAYRAFQRTPSTASCFAVVTAQSNIRSEPYKDPNAPDNNVVKRLSEDTKLAVTGKRTEGGWIEVKLPEKSSAWVYSKLITNESEINSCLKASKTRIQVVADRTLIPAPSPSIQPTPDESPKPIDVKPVNKPTPKDEGANILAKATEKFQSGDLNSAIALLKSIPSSSPSYQKAQETITQLQKTWTTAETTFKNAEKAFNEGRWQDVFTYLQNPELTNNPYWRDKLQELVTAAQKQQKAEKPSPSPSISPTFSPGSIKNSTSKPSPGNNPTPSPNPTKSASDEPQL